MSTYPAGRSALVFDRAPMVAETVAMVLTDAGYTVEPTVTYRDAKRAFQNMTDLDLMVIHADTPGERRGSNLLQEALRHRPNAAVVVVSSRLPQDIAPFPRSAVFLEKPFSRDQLLAAIERAREARPSR